MSLYVKLVLTFIAEVCALLPAAMKILLKTQLSCSFFSNPLKYTFHKAPYRFFSVCYAHFSAESRLLLMEHK